MSEGSWLDLMPSSERARIRKKLRSPEVYAETREKVKSPEEIKKEMEWNEKVAELRFGLESEPELKKALKKQIEKDLREGGVEAVLQHSDLPPDVKQAIEDGKFDVIVDAPDEGGRDQLVVLPEGNVSEKIPLKKTLGDSYVSQFNASV